MLRYLARCPACGSSLRRSEVFRSGPRICKGCNSVIRPVPFWDQLGNCVVGLLMLAFIIGVTVVSEGHPLAQIGGAVFFFFFWMVLGGILFPYVTPFEVVGRQSRCGVCGYDLRATPRRCPECGTAPSGVAADSPLPLPDPVEELPPLAN